MQILPVDEFVAHPRRALSLLRESDVALTRGGRPVVVLMRIENGDLEETLRLVQRVRAAAAVSKMRAQAKKIGTNRMRLDEINAEIRAVRRQRKSA
jgi:hypothetical protein